MKFSCHCFSSLVGYNNCFCINRICCNITCQNFRKKKRVWRNVFKPYRKWRKVFKIPLALLHLLEKVSRSKYLVPNFLRGFWLHWQFFVLHAVWHMCLVHILCQYQLVDLITGMLQFDLNLHGWSQPCQRSYKIKAILATVVNEKDFRITIQIAWCKIIVNLCRTIFYLLWSWVIDWLWVGW